MSRAAILIRVDCSESELASVLVELAGEGLVRSPTDPRLTFEGFAVALATIPRASAAAPASAHARTAA